MVNRTGSPCCRHTNCAVPGRGSGRAASGCSLARAGFPLAGHCCWEHQRSTQTTSGFGLVGAEAFCSACSHAELGGISGQLAPILYPLTAYLPTILVFTHQMTAFWPDAVVARAQGPPLRRPCWWGPWYGWPEMQRLNLRAATCSCTTQTRFASMTCSATMRCSVLSAQHLGGAAGPGDPGAALGRGLLQAHPGGHRRPGLPRHGRHAVINILHVYMCILQCVGQCAMQQVTLQYKRVWFGWPAVRSRPSSSGPASTAHQSLGLLHRQDDSV